MSDIQEPKTTRKSVPRLNTTSKSRSKKSTRFSKSFKDEQEYVELSPRSHARQKPQMYIGNIKREQRIETALRVDGETNELCFLPIDVDTPPAMIRCFIEILSNAVDNVIRSRAKKIDPGKIIVEITSDLIAVTNYGDHIPVRFNEASQMYEPERIFGCMLTSSNFEKRVDSVCGSHGIGSKVTNINSKEFRVECYDPNRGALYKQAWYDTMKRFSDPEIIECELEDAYTKVEFTLDQSRFDDYIIDDNFISLCAKICADGSFSVKVPIVFNNMEFNYSEIIDYASLYFQVGEHFISHEQKFKFEASQEIHPTSINILISDAGDNPGRVIGLVNGVHCNEGVHINKLVKTVTGPLVKKLKDMKITQADIMGQLNFVVNYLCKGQAYASQDKVKLTQPEPTVKFKKNALEQLNNWPLIKRLESLGKAKGEYLLSKTDGKKNRQVITKKGRDAAFAGSTRSHECSLYICEGESAANFLLSALDILDVETTGIYPLKGVIMNITYADDERLIKNREYTDIKSLLGLRENIDYMKEENYNTLRYGRVYICCDSDVFGSHISGLMMNVFHRKFRTLFQRGYFVNTLKTPMLTIKQGKIHAKFYCEFEFKEWCEQNKKIRIDPKNIKFIKGLGTNEDEDVVEEFANPHYIRMEYDEHASENFQLAFSNDASKRKDWIKNYIDSTVRICDLEIQNASDFINNDLKYFSIISNRKMLPSIFDGMKECQRKILWAAFSEWSTNGRWKTPAKCNKIKVADFGSIASTLTAYQHGEVSLQKCIVLMSQTYPTSNNMPYLKAIGQFGSRHTPKASAPRYISVTRSLWIDYVYREEDFPLLEILEDEGKKIEPKYYLPIIPMLLVNGSKGISVAYSTFIPKYNPMKLVLWMRRKLLGKQLPKLIPYYEGYSGNIQLKLGDAAYGVENEFDEDDLEIDIGKDISNQLQNKKDEEYQVKIKSEIELSNELLELPESSDEQKDLVAVIDVNLDTKKRYRMVSMGEFEVIGKKIIVTELPLGRSFDSYSDALNKMIENKQLTRYENLCKKNQCKYILYSFKGNPNHENLLLIRSFRLSNMVALDENNTPVLYNDPEEICEKFYQMRLPYYTLRKENMLAVLKEQLRLLNLKLKFVKLVVNDELEIRNRSKADIEIDLKQHKIPVNIYMDCPLPQLNKEKIKELEDEIPEIKEKYDELLKVESSDMWLNDLEEFENKYKTIELIHI